MHLLDLLRHLLGYQADREMGIWCRSKLDEAESFTEIHGQKDSPQISIWNQIRSDLGELVLDFVISLMGTFHHFDVFIAVTCPVH